MRKLASCIPCSPCRQQKKPFISAETKTIESAEAAESAALSAEVEGVWHKGSIQGNKVIWNSGTQETLEVLSPTSVKLKQQYGLCCKAELASDGTLRWDDGDVWRRLPQEPAAQAESPGTLRCGDGAVLEVPAALGSPLKSSASSSGLPPGHGMSNGDRWRRSLEVPAALESSLQMTPSSPSSLPRAKVLMLVPTTSRFSSPAVSPMQALDTSLDSAESQAVSTVSTESQIERIVKRSQAEAQAMAIEVSRRELKLAPTMNFFDHLLTTEVRNIARLGAQHKDFSRLSRSDAQFLYFDEAAGSYYYHTLGPVALASVDEGMVVVMEGFREQEFASSPCRRFVREALRTEALSEESCNSLKNCWFDLAWRIGPSWIEVRERLQSREYRTFKLLHFDDKVASQLDDKADVVLWDGDQDHPETFAELISTFLRADTDECERHRIAVAFLSKESAPDFHKRYWRWYKEFPGRVWIVFLSSAGDSLQNLDIPTMDEHVCSIGEKAVAADISPSIGEKAAAIDISPDNGKSLIGKKVKDVSSQRLGIVVSEDLSDSRRYYKVNFADCPESSHQWLPHTAVEALEDVDANTYW